MVVAVVVIVVVIVICCDINCMQVVHMVYNPSKQHAKPRKGSSGNKTNHETAGHGSTENASMAASSHSEETMTVDTSCHPNKQSATGASSAAAAATTGADIDNNKMNARLKEMFKERITAFREAVYLLTGYKVLVFMCAVVCIFACLHISRVLRHFLIFNECVWYRFLLIGRFDIC